MSKWTSKSCRFISMMGLTTSFFLIEIVVGYVTNSLALVADSFHMLSDVVALFVGFSSVRVSKWSSSKNTFGWARAEVMGALVNSVFLIALCFSIFCESIQRFIEMEKVENPVLLLVVGGAGLLVNIIGLALFAEHGHSHGGGGSHSHGGGGSHSHKKRQEHPKRILTVESQIDLNGGVDDGALSVIDITPSHDQCADAPDSSDHHVTNAAGADDGNSPRGESIPNSSAQLNMRGVFLHVLGDALGSVIVLISAGLILGLKDDVEWVHYVDPALSIVLVVIIMFTTVPLFRESSMILMQTVPTHIQVQHLQDKLVSKVDGVLGVHEFHVWQLAGSRIIASAHIRCHNLRDYMKIAENVKEFFHREGIHSTTIQPEFVEGDEITQLENKGRNCALECGPERDCFTDTCCGKSGLASGETGPAGGMRLSRSEAQIRHRPPTGETAPVAEEENCV